MAIRVANLRLGLAESEQALPDRLAQILGISGIEELPWRILRKSLDTRNKSNLQFVYSIEATLPEESPRLLAQLKRRHPELHIEPYRPASFHVPEPGPLPLESRPVIVGSGPAGLFAAFLLAERGYQPLVLERGPPVHQRIRDVHLFDKGGAFDSESNYLFGEGGAGTFSDGKLTCRNSGPDVQRVLDLFAECKGKDSVRYEYRPHLGSNRLPAVVKALRQRIESLGGEFRFGCRVEDLVIQDGRLRQLCTSSGAVKAQVALLAIGHSARDTYRMLAKRGVALAPKPFQMGVRIEQPQEIVNRVQYGETPLEERLGAADYSLIAHGRRDLFTFCMCAGGQIIPSVSEPGYFCTNGMSLSKRASPFANSGLVVTIEPDEFGSREVLAGVQFQEIYEGRAFAVGLGDYACPVQRAVDFLADRRSEQLPPCSYTRGVVAARLDELIPPQVREALHEGLPILDRRWRGRFLAAAILAGPEARGSSPVRIVRDRQTRESLNVQGLYPVGEGAGYAGGIVSAAVDGLRSAKAVIAKYAPLS
ncbi:MAG: hypothetical protein KatS3mg105_1115 [Gemmatales bacterium]|nr:MAG: hypothetical protein KatS3mg105_1115 [Gemmatales bacterium]